MLIVLVAVPTPVSYTHLDVYKRQVLLSKTILVVTDYLPLKP